MKLNKTYSICGYMGVGKTSLIKKVMQKKNFKCLDLDEFIAEKYGPIDIIFINLKFAIFIKLNPSQKPLIVCFPSFCN